MNEILLEYQRPEPTTWVYLSSFLTLGLFFVFHRMWSLRNLDVVLLILLAPGLLMVQTGRRDAIDSQLKNRQAAVMTQPDVRVPSDPETPRDPETQPDAETLPPPPQESLSAANNAATGATNKDAVARGETAQQSVAADPQTPNTSTGNLSVDPTRDDGAPIGQALSGEVIAAANALDDDSGTGWKEARQAADNRARRRFGFLWLFGVQALILVRLLIDPMLVRRPMLDPNLTSGGLIFIGLALFIFLMANVVTSTPRLQAEQGPQLGPGYPLMNKVPSLPTRSGRGLGRPDTNAVPESAQTVIARVLVIAAHMAVLAGIVLIGYRHFHNTRAGIGCATLYLLLPYTAQTTGRVDHVVPAAMLVWAILMYRKPLASGIFLGLAGGLLYYPLFLLPLWISFYWKRGLGPFLGGVGGTLVVLMGLLLADGRQTFFEHLQQMYGLWFPLVDDLDGFWALDVYAQWRLPLLVVFGLLAGFFAVWPKQKNLGTLICCTAALMVACQFWHGFGGGLYIAWFLPLLLLTIYRPNLEDRVALKVISGPRGEVKLKVKRENEAA